MKNQHFLLAVMVIAALAVAGCVSQPGQQQQTPQQPGGQTPNQNSSPQIYSVEIRSFSFGPADLTVKQGDTVVWTNYDSAPHTITSDPGQSDIASNELNSDQLSTGQTFSHTFNTIGTFEYHCSIHTDMRAKITVVS